METLKRTKETLDKFFNQAKESIRVLEVLQKEAVSVAKNAIQSQNLKKLGLATQSEIRELEKKVEDLASELRGQISKLRKSQSSKKDSNLDAKS